MSIFKKIAKSIKKLFSCNKGKKKQESLPFNNYLWSLKTFDDLRAGFGLPSTFNSVKASLNWKVKNIDKNILITDKPSKFVKDTHNYVSLATYYWPNPDTEDGLPYIVKDGYRNPECDDYDLPKLQKLADSLKHLAMSYAMDPQDEKYDTFTLLVYNWFVNKDTMMYPNFRYCQIGPGTNNNEGINSFESYFLLDVFESIAYMNSLKPLPTDIIPVLTKWLAELVDFLENSPQGKFENRMTNNHSIMYDTGLIYFKILATGKLDANILKRLYNRIDKQIASDGSQPEELKRNQGYKYSVYNLDHIVDAFRIIKSTGETIPDNIYYKVKNAFTFLKQFETKESFNAKYIEIGDWNGCYDYYMRIAARLEFEEYNFYRDVNFLFL